MGTTPLTRKVSSRRCEDADALMGGFAVLGTAREEENIYVGIEQNENN